MPWGFPLALRAPSAKALPVCVRSSERSFLHASWINRVSNETLGRGMMIKRIMNIFQASSFNFLRLKSRGKCRSRVMSRVLCRSAERVCLPLGVNAVEHAVGDAFQGLVVVHDGHGSGSSSHLPKDPLNGVYRAQGDPKGGGSWKWANNVSRSLSMHATALGSRPRHCLAHRQKAAMAARRLWAS